MTKIKDFCKKEAVLLIAAAAAILSCFFIHPDREYLSYIDFSVLAILFCLMAVVAGFVKSGVFSSLSRLLLKNGFGVRRLALLLVLATFFSAMLVTNDVALLTFVPLTIGLFGAKDQKRLIYTVVLETIAANLGSMLTPIGNPQNLYLYSFFNLSLSDFLGVVALPCAAGLLLLLCALLFLKDKQLEAPKTDQTGITDPRRLVVYIILFILCVLTVLRVLDWRVTLGITAITVLLCDIHLYKKIDWSLLLTFIAFFIFVGNLRRIDAVSSLLQTILSGREFLVSVLLSQIISNVPAAVMLSGFTQNARALLLGVDLGGLGTLVASLASLISFRLYAKSESAKPGKFFLVFTLCNLIFLLPLLFFGLLL